MDAMRSVRVDAMRSDQCVWTKCDEIHTDACVCIACDAMHSRGVRVDKNVMRCDEMHTRCIECTRCRVVVWCIMLLCAVHGGAMGCVCGYSAMKCTCVYEM